MTCADAQAVTHALGGRWHGAYGTAPCPAHDDRSPSLSLKDGRDGRLLAYCHAGCDWRAVRDALRGMGHLPGRGEAPTPLDPAVKEAREREERRDAERRAAQALRCWKGTRPLAGTPAEAYLRGRGITGPLPPTLRFHPACWHGPTARRHPALVARVEGAERFAVHRTYLARDGRGRRIDHHDAGRREDAKMMLGHTLGGAVRLAGREEPPRRARGPGSLRAPGPLVVAEGIETALSVASGAAGPLGPGARVWAALAANGMAGLRLPARAGPARHRRRRRRGRAPRGACAGRAGAGHRLAGSAPGRPRRPRLERRAGGGGRGLRAACSRTRMSSDRTSSTRAKTAP